MARRLNAVPETPVRPRPPDLRDAVDEAVGAMPWAQGTDGAMVALAKRLAAEIEQVSERATELAELYAATAGDGSTFKRLQKLEAMCEATKVVGWLGPQLQGVLKELGGSPQSRKAMQTTSPVGGALAAIRAGLPGTAGSGGRTREDDTANLDPPAS